MTAALLALATLAATLYAAPAVAFLLDTFDRAPARRK